MQRLLTRKEAVGGGLFFFFFPKPKDFDLGLLNLSAGTSVALRNSG